MARAAFANSAQNRLDRGHLTSFVQSDQLAAKSVIGAPGSDVSDRYGFTYVNHLAAMQMSVNSAVAFG